MRLLVLDSGGDNARFTTAVSEAAGQGAKLVIVGNGAGTLAQSVEGFEAVSLAANHVPRPKNTLAFGDDKTTSLAEGIIFSAANGARDVVLIAPDNHDREELNWLASKLSAITRISVVTYAKNANARQAVSRNRKKLAAADAIAFAASDKSVEAISQALGNSDAKDVQLIGHTGWPASFYKIKSLNGAIIARPEANDLGQLARRYQSAYGTPISISAAYGYDLVAVAAGIVRVLGPNALNRKNLLSSSGFKGSTGGSFASCRMVRLSAFMPSTQSRMADCPKSKVWPRDFNRPTSVGLGCLPCTLRGVQCHRYCVNRPFAG